jgi:hypothetical protein
MKGRGARRNRPAPRKQQLRAAPSPSDAALVAVFFVGVENFLATCTIVLVSCVSLPNAGRVPLHPARFFFLLRLGLRSVSVFFWGVLDGR